MREIELLIPDFNVLVIKEFICDINPLYLKIKITLKNNINNFNSNSCPFDKNINKNKIPFCNKFKSIEISLFKNDMIEKILEYLFSDQDSLTTYSGNITPMGYKIKLIESLCLFDD